jgi:hypothetical protein
MLFTCARSIHINTDRKQLKQVLHFRFSFEPKFSEVDKSLFLAAPLRTTSCNVHYSWPIRRKGVGIVLGKDDGNSNTPGFYCIRFKFDVVSDSVSDSSWNSVSLRKSFKHSNCINRQIYCKGRHSSTLLCASFCVVFIAIQQTMTAGKIAKDCYFRLLLYMHTWFVKQLLLLY